ncbi:hypothetical protein RB213_012114 [Colletotrichum asianum]
MANIAIYNIATADFSNTSGTFAAENDTRILTEAVLANVLVAAGVLLLGAGDHKRANRHFCWGCSCAALHRRCPAAHATEGVVAHVPIFWDMHLGPGPRAAPPKLRGSRRSRPTHNLFFYDCEPLRPRTSPTIPLGLRIFAMLKHSDALKAPIVGPVVALLVCQSTWAPGATHLDTNADAVVPCQTGNGDDPGSNAAGQEMPKQPLSSCTVSRESVHRSLHPGCGRSCYSPTTTLSTPVASRFLARNGGGADAALRNFTRAP